MNRYSISFTRRPRPASPAPAVPVPANSAPAAEVMGLVGLNAALIRYLSHDADGNARRGYPDAPLRTLGLHQPSAEEWDVLTRLMHALSVQDRAQHWKGVALIFAQVNPACRERITDVFTLLAATQTRAWKPVKGDAPFQADLDLRTRYDLHLQGVAQAVRSAGTRPDVTPARWISSV